uniref:NAD(P)(+)--arginine ADP-ribosyltransferase n=1 Tax=Hemiselmis tepida TaxID=464990 RepID=A0A7S0W5B3_9CRYP
MVVLMREVQGGGTGVSKALGEKKVSTSREEARQLFGMADDGEDQYLDKEEVRRALSKRKIKMSPKELDETFKSMDVNSDGKIDFWEFERSILKLEHDDGRWNLDKRHGDRLKQCWELMNGNKDNVLDEEERKKNRRTLTGLLVELGMGPKALDEVKGKLTYDSFKSQVRREIEVTRKEQSLVAANLTRAVAECIAGGDVQNPLENLEKMTQDEMDRFCETRVLKAVKRRLKMLQNDLILATDKRKGAQKKDRTGGNGKFAVGTDVGSTKTATFGGLEDFHKGIDDLGLPNPNIMEGMMAEHCNRDDSKTKFNPGNYDTETCSADEWEIVSDEKKGKAVSGGPHNRVVKSKKELMAHPDVKAAGLEWEEVLALQLYTGPMYCKYNAVLRNFPESMVKLMHGNKYTTTIHCIVSGIIKLSKSMKLPEDRKVYRGLGGLELPEAFTKPDAFGVRGGCEFAMMSTTVDRQVALQYAGQNVPTIFEIEVGGIDRGASVKFVSQYPGEEEILLPPRSYLEVVDGVPRVEAGPDGRMVRVVQLQVNANVMTSTIEKIVGNRKGMFVSWGENLLLEIQSQLRLKLESGEVRKALVHRPFDASQGIPEKLVAKIVDDAAAWLEQYRRRDGSWFNEDEFRYARAIKELTALENLAIGKLDAWISGAGGLTGKALVQEAMEQVQRRVESEMQRKLDDLTPDKGNMTALEPLEDPEGRKLCLELCKRRGVVIMDIEETEGQLGEPPIVSSGASGDVTSLKLLLRAKCNVNATASDKSTALHRASMMGHLKYVSYLVRAGGDVKLKDGRGRTCLHVACEMGHSDVIRFLVEQGKKALCLEPTAEGETCAYLAAQMGHTAALQQVFEGGGDELLGRVESKGATCMHAAARGGHLEALKWLVEREKEAKGGQEMLLGATKNGASCLYIAASNGHDEVVEYLLNQGGKKLMNMVTKDTWTCAHIASKNGHVKVLRKIKQHGDAGVRLLEQKTEKGRSCLSFAEAEMKQDRPGMDGLTNVCKFLREQGITH